ncbi:MAG: DegV family protein [Chloroflexi bacterium]|nr:DegV family protein [Chloroflexota bacterium]
MSSSRILFVTDSTATFEHPHFPEDYGLTLVPVNVRFGQHAYRHLDDIDNEEMLQRMQHVQTLPSVEAPSVAAFEQVYKRLCQVSTQICVIVHSRHLSRTYDHAVAARESLLGRCDIAVIDSQTMSVGLAYTVEKMIEMAAFGATLDDLMRASHSLTHRVYSVIYATDLDYIRRSGLLDETQTIVGSMLDVKPLISMEDGRLIAMEKARTHAQAIDKIIEFVTEFTAIERLAVVQTTRRSNDRTRMLQDRLALELTRHNYPVLQYDPLTACSVGLNSLGIFVLEES